MDSSCTSYHLKWCSHLQISRKRPGAWEIVVESFRFPRMLPHITSPHANTSKATDRFWTHHNRFIQSLGIWPSPRQIISMSYQSPILKTLSCVIITWRRKKSCPSTSIIRYIFFNLFSKMLSASKPWINVNQFRCLWFSNDLTVDFFWMSLI
jgi:hypothetical protein